MVGENAEKKGGPYMAKIVIVGELCKSCGYCIAVCPQKIIRVGERTNSKGYRFVEQFDAEKCTGCKLCAIMCPDAAIEVYK